MPSVTYYSKVSAWKDVVDSNEEGRRKKEEGRRKRGKRRRGRRGRRGKKEKR
jgi:hypothetical protein